MKDLQEPRPGSRPGAKNDPVDALRTPAAASSTVPIDSPFKSRGGLGRILGASRNTVAGFRSTWQTEHAFRQELAVAVPAAVIALLLPVSLLEKFLLVAVLLLVLLVEMLNSAIEAVVDRISLERHPLSKHAKDAGSAAVFLAMLIAALAWMAVLFPLLWPVLQSWVRSMVP